LDGWEALSDQDHKVIIKGRRARDEWGRAFLLGEGLALSGTAVVALRLDDVAILALGAGLVALGGDQALVASLAV
jgi:hypothetical protein